MTLPISIIVPVYNAEKYLKQCLDSIKEQTFTNWEAILVDDGSTDNSGKICEEYSETDNRFTVIHQHNQGASTARNIGIERANGDWITFIDADDYVDANYLECLYKHNDYAEKTLIIQGLKQISNNRIANNIEFAEETLTGKDVEKAFDGLRIFEHGYTVAKLYNNRMIQQKNIRFDKDISYSEDMLFMMEYILGCETIKFVEGSGYNYVVDASNLSLKYNQFESEYHLFNKYDKLNNAIAQKFSFKPTENSLRNGAMILMRSLYSIYINKSKNSKDRLNIIKGIRKKKYTYIKEYYKPQIVLFKVIKLAFTIHPLLFDTICRIKFR